MIHAAQAFCVAAHQGQKRKYDGSPYWTHPFAVANILRKHVSSEPMIAAAYLHDVLEDTKVTYDEIEYIFDEEVAELVLGLTDVSTPSDGNRAARKAIDRAHTLEQCDKVQIIKCADIIHNASTFLEGQGGYWKAEKRLLLEDMRINNTAIWREAWLSVI